MRGVALKDKYNNNNNDNININNVEEEEYYVESPRKEFFFSVGLVKVVTVLVIFMGGAVLGLSLSTTFTRYYYPSQIDVIIPRAVSVAANCDRDCAGMASFITPERLGHTMTDDQLFWRASMVPSKPDYPFHRVPKVAFLFLTRGSLPLAPLWDRFFHGHDSLFSVYVHAFPGYTLNVSTTSAFFARQIPSQDVEWGTITLVDAEKRLLSNALLDFSNEYFVLLSESCIPIFNFPKVYDYLLNSQYSFVEMYDEDSPTGRGRYDHRMAPEVRMLDWRKGSEWFEMTREMAVFVVADSKYHSLFRKYCKPACYSDEHYIPTYINLFHAGLNANRTLTWVDWSRGGPHPATFGGEDVTAEFIESMRNNGTAACTYNDKPTDVCYLFARKFAPGALEPLLSIASAVMKY